MLALMHPDEVSEIRYTLKKHATWGWRSKKAFVLWWERNAWAHLPRFLKQVVNPEKVKECMRGRPRIGQWQSLPPAWVPVEVLKLHHNPAEPLPPWVMWGKIHAAAYGRFRVTRPKWDKYKLTVLRWPCVATPPSPDLGPSQTHILLRNLGVLRDE